MRLLAAPPDLVGEDLIPPLACGAREEDEEEEGRWKIKFEYMKIKKKNHIIIIFYETY